jgi:putative OPT family oligopeptide transporter
MLIQLLSTLAMGLLFFVVTRTVNVDGAAYTMGESVLYAIVGMIVGFALSFLFTPVAAEAIAIVGVNPVSGMTMITLILGSAVMVAVGLTGAAGIFVAVVIGAAVCTALSTSGALISDFKIGYWIGATPRQQQVWKFLGVVVAALVVAVVVPVMDNAYHFLVPIDPNNVALGLTSNTEALPAPQANMLSEIVKAMMTDVGQPYLLYALGALIALMLIMAGVPPLPFSLGMYLPISITFSMLFGAIVSWLVGKSSRDEKVAKARAGQGTLIASGLMAGAAIFGIVAALLRVDWNELFGTSADWLRYPVRFLSQGADYTVAKTATGASFLKECPVHPDPSNMLPGCAVEPSAWVELYHGTGGQVLGLSMFVVLGGLVFLLARWGANKDMEESRGR